MPRYCHTLPIHRRGKYIPAGQVFYADNDSDVPVGAVNLDSCTNVGSPEVGSEFVFDSENSAFAFVHPKSTRCVVLGDGPSVYKGILWMIGKSCDFDVICVNRAGIKWVKPFLAWVTRHPDNFDAWCQLRQACGLKIPALISDSTVQTKYGPIYNSVNSTNMGSGEYALEVAQRFGFSRIVLAGFDLTGAYAAYSNKFLTLKDDSIRALHGKTKEIFGFPAKGWFEG